MAQPKIDERNNPHSTVRLAPRLRSLTRWASGFLHLRPQSRWLQKTSLAVSSSLTAPPATTSRPSSSTTFDPSTIQHDSPSGFDGPRQTELTSTLGNSSLIQTSNTVAEQAIDSHFDHPTVQLLDSTVTARPASPHHHAKTLVDSASTSNRPAHHTQLDEVLPDLTEKIQRPLGEPMYIGPYSRVYKGWCGQDQVAIKVVYPVGELHAVRRRMRREVETASCFNHPNVLPVWGVIEADWCLYGCLITPWCRNGDASRYIHQVGMSERFLLLRGVAAGLEYLHARSVVHGDLKPGNILINDLGNPLICDFGLTRILDSGGRGQSDGDDVNTTTVHCGTVRYLAFELVEPDTPAERSKASDVHALGCVGYEFVYLKKPYSFRINNTGGHIFRDIANGTPPARRPLDPLTPDEYSFWALLELCWDTHSDVRPDVSTFCRSLRTITELEQ